MGPLGILGAGGHGRVVADAAEAAGWRDLVFFDNGAPGDLYWAFGGNEAALLGRLHELAGVVVGIGANAARLDWHRRLAAEGAPLVSIIHPRATISSYTSIGAGTVVFAGAVVNIGAKIGEAVIVNTGATIDHDCFLADGVHVSPGANLAGGASVGELSWIGIGASVREMIAVGPRVKVGAGATVVCSISEGLTVVGVPARPVLRVSNA